MAMAVGGSEGEPMMDINTTPLIDVMLVLLILFIITLPITKHSVKLDMPTGGSPPTTQPVVINLEIDFDGTILWNNNPVNDWGTLQSYFVQAAAQDPQPELHVRPNRLAKYDVVAKVLATAQRNGIKRIGFVGNEQFL